MKTRIVGIKETSTGVFRLSFDGKILGDSRGYRRDEAVSAARSFVSRNAVDGRWEGSTWVEFRNVLDSEIE